MQTRILSVLGTAALLLSGFCSLSFGAETPAKTTRPAIYDEKADGSKQIVPRPDQIALPPQRHHCFLVLKTEGANLRVRRFVRLGHASV
jgi:hypothetical protein